MIDQEVVANPWAGLRSMLLSGVEECKPFTLDDMARLFEHLKNAARAGPTYFTVSPKTAKRIWRFTELAKLDKACPLPTFKLRKCIMRKIYAKRHAGLARINRKERIRDAEEQRIIQGYGIKQ